MSQGRPDDQHDHGAGGLHDETRDAPYRGWQAHQLP